MGSTGRGGRLGGGGPIPPTGGRGGEGLAGGGARTARGRGQAKGRGPPRPGAGPGGQCSWECRAAREAGGTCGGAAPRALTGLVRHIGSRHLGNATHFRPRGPAPEAAEVGGAKGGDRLGSGWPFCF